MSRWNCPHCRGPIGPAPDLAGKTVACPYCLVPVSVPGLSVGRRTDGHLKRFLIMLLLLTAGFSTAFILYDVPLAKMIAQISADGQMELDRLDVPRVEPELFLSQPTIFQDACATDMDIPPQSERIHDRITEPIHSAEPRGPQSEIQLTAADLPSEHDTDTEPGRIDELSSSHGLSKDELTTQHASAGRSSTDNSSTDNSVNIYLGNPAYVESDSTKGSVDVKQSDSLDLAQTSVTSFNPTGLGISRDEIAHAIQEYFDVKFEVPDKVDSGEEGSVAGFIDDTKITLWGSPNNLQSVTVHGGFDGEKMAIALAAIISRIIPEWEIEDAGDWFSKAIHRCDTETFVSTFRDNVEVTMTTAFNSEKFWIFIQPDR